MKEKTAIYLIFLFCFIAGLFVGNIIRKPCTPDSLPARLQIDTVWVEIRDTVPSHPAEIQYIPKEVPAVVDTAAILRDYFAQRIYEDSTLIDEHLTLTIRDTISENTISGRSIAYDLRIPEITRTITLKPKYTLSLLADTRLTPSLLFGYKQLYIQTGYDFGRKQPFVGVGLKLWER